MPRDESRYPADWARIAEKDWQRAGRLLEAKDVEGAGFFLQQAVEKFLKAFLLSHDWKLQRTHDLEALLNAALPYDVSLEAFREVCQKVTSFYLVERYPLMTEPGLEREDVHESMEFVAQLVDKLRKAIA